jgi:hypothetical protein
VLEDQILAVLEDQAAVLEDQILAVLEDQAAVLEDQILAVPESPAATQQINHIIKKQDQSVDLKAFFL